MGFPLPSNDPLGTDISLDENGDLTVGLSGDLQTVTQEKNVEQALRVDLSTTPETYFWDDDIGSYLASYVDQPITPRLEKDIISIVTQKATNDSRIISVDKVIIDDTNQDTLIIFVSVVVAGVGDMQIPIIVRGGA